MKYKPTKEEIAWAAGLFEGEGCIRLGRQQNGICRRLCLNMCDKDAVERLQRIFDAGKVVPKKVYGKRKPQWLLQVSSWPDVKRIGSMLLPHLCARTILSVLYDAMYLHNQGSHPSEWVSRDYIADQSGYSLTSSGFSTSLSTLRTLELVEERTTATGKEMRISEVFFG